MALLAHLSFQQNDPYAPYNTYFARYTVSWPLAYQTAHPKKISGTYCCMSVAYQVHLVHTSTRYTSTYKYQVRPRTSIAYTWYCCSEYLCFIHQYPREISFPVGGGVVALLIAGIPTLADDISAATRIRTTRVPGIS